MGVVISDYEFDKVDMMKDLELARHKLDDKNSKLANNLLIEEKNIRDSEPDQVPLLEWINEDSEEENFILVQSRKRKKEQRKLKNSLSVNSCRKDNIIPTRTSKRTTPSLYRVNVGQENPDPGKLRHHSKNNKQ